MGSTTKGKTRHGADGQGDAVQAVEGAGTKAGLGWAPEMKEVRRAGLLPKAIAWRAMH